MRVFAVFRVCVLLWLCLLCLCLLCVWRLRCFVFAVFVFALCFVFAHFVGDCVCSVFALCSLVEKHNVSMPHTPGLV